MRANLLRTILLPLALRLLFFFRNLKSPFRQSDLQITQYGLRRTSALGIDDCEPGDIQNLGKLFLG